MNNIAAVVHSWLWLKLIRPVVRALTILGVHNEMSKKFRDSAKLFVVDLSYRSKLMWKPNLEE